MTAEETYPLPRTLTESERLNRQHRVLARAGFFVHPSLDLSACSHILDHAAGTGVWSAAVASEHAGQLKSDCNFELADVSAAQFPSPLPPRVADAYLHNALEPFPEDKREQYDLVHQRYLWGGLKRDEWLPAIKHLKEALKPGGYLSLHEMSAIILAKEGDTTPATSDEPDALVGTLCQRFADAAGLDNSLPDHLPNLMRQAGFTDVQAVCRSVAIGRSAAHLGEDQVRESVDNLVDVATAFLGIGYNKGMFKDMFATEKGFHDALAAGFEATRKKGGYWPQVMVVGRKP